MTLRYQTQSKAGSRQDKAAVLNFFDLEAWKKAHQLVLEIYRITKAFPAEEKFGLVSQLRRAAYSISANIAEGFARYHFKDKVRFYHQARGSAAEVQNFLILAKDLSMANESTCKEFGKEAREVARLINGMIRSIQRQS